MLEGLLEVLFEFLGELLIQLLGQLISSGFQALVSPRLARMLGRKPERASVSVKRELFVSLAYGAVCGAGTLLVYPQLTLRDPTLQLANLAVSPLIAGLAVERIRALRGEHHGFRIDTFAYAALFALVFASVRYGFGH